MRDKVVLVCTNSDRNWRLASPPLAGAGNQVLRAADTEDALELIRSGSIDLLFYDWPSALDPHAVLAAARDCLIPVVGLAGEDRRAAIASLVCQHNVLNICSPLAEDGGQLTFDPSELVTTGEKILRRDCFGLEKYIAGFGVEIRHRVVVRADERDRLVEQLAELVRSLGGGRRVVDSVALVTDELITNAVYNAPRDRDGKARYAHLDRRYKVVLEPTEYVRVEYGSNGRRFGLAVIDSFGALEPSTLRAGVRRCLTETDQIEQKAGGAGIGLYTALSQANQLIVNLEPGTRTEVIAVWDLDRRGRGAGAAAGSLHVFATDETAAARRRRRTTEMDRGDGGEAVPEPTVTLSDTFRAQLATALATRSGRPGAHRHLSVVGEGGQPRTAAGGRIVCGELHVDEVEVGPTGDHWGGDVEIREVELADSDAAGRQALDLFALRRVRLLRRSDRPGLELTLTSIRGARTLASGIEAALTYLVNEWSVAALLCHVGGALIPWTGAGDVDGWDELSGAPIPLGPPDANGVAGGGWLASQASRTGVSAGELGADSAALRLASTLLGEEAGQGIALAIGAGSEVAFLLFACGEPSGEREKLGRYELLQRELSRLCERVADSAKTMPHVVTSWANA